MYLVYIEKEIKKIVRICCRCRRHRRRDPSFYFISNWFYPRKKRATVKILAFSSHTQMHSHKIESKQKGIGTWHYLFPFYFPHLWLGIFTIKIFHCVCVYHSDGREEKNAISLWWVSNILSPVIVTWQRSISKKKNLTSANYHERKRCNKRTILRYVKALLQTMASNGWNGTSRVNDELKANDIKWTKAEWKEEKKCHWPVKYDIDCISHSLIW